MQARAAKCERQVFTAGRGRVQVRMIMVHKAWERCCDRRYARRALLPLLPLLPGRPALNGISPCLHAGWRRGRSVSCDVHAGSGSGSGRPGLWGCGRGQQQVPSARHVVPAPANATHALAQAGLHCCHLLVAGAAQGTGGGGRCGGHAPQQGRAGSNRRSLQRARRLPAPSLALARPPALHSTRRTYMPPCPCC